MNAQVNYTLPGGRQFTIQPDSGDICISAPLDHETRAVYEFPVVAMDRGQWIGRGGSGGGGVWGSAFLGCSRHRRRRHVVAMDRGQSIGRGGSGGEGVWGQPSTSSPAPYEFHRAGRFRRVPIQHL